MASVSKRTWTYQGQPRTAWTVRYREGGKHLSKQFERKKEADEYRRQVENRLAAGVPTVAAARPLVAQVVREYLAQAELRLEDGRISRNRWESLLQSMRVCVIPYLGQEYWADLTPEKVEAFYTWMRKEKGHAVRTAKMRMAALKLLEDFALKRRYAIDRPITEARKDLRGGHMPPVRTFTAEQVSHLLALSLDRGWKCHLRPLAMLACGVHLAAFCGLRWGEIMGLTLGALDFDLGIVRVRHSLDAWDDLRGPKTAAGVRDVPMPSVVRELLKGWIAAHMVRDGRELIFRMADGAMVSHSAYRMNWKLLLKRAGLNDDGSYHFHALRHFAASWMIQTGLPITDVATLLGHSQFDTTLQTYAHPVMRPSERHAEFERMAKMLPPPPQSAHRAHEPKLAA